MSKRQPTIEIDDQVIAHDEIVEFVNFNCPAPRKENNHKIVVNAVKLVSGRVLPLTPHKLGGVISFLYQNDH